MFVTFTTPDGLAMHVRASRVVAFTRLEEGGTRIFLGGALSCIVAEDDDEVGRRLKPGGDDEA